MSKLRTIIVLAGSLGGAVPITANADISDLFGVGHEMPASVDETVHLGMPFNAMSGQFQHYRCINGPVIEAVENGNSELSLQQGLTESEIRNYLSGSISAGFNSELLDGVLGAEAGAGLARSLSESETSISYSYGYELEKIVESLVVNSFDNEGYPEFLSSECHELIDVVSNTAPPFDDTTLASMGTHILTNISYGASLFANLKITARTVAEKSEINGMLDISSGILDISGDLSDLSADTRRNTIVEVYVRQLGGEPRKLLESLGAQNGNDGTAVVARCDLNDIDTCRDIFTEIIHYSKDGFQHSLVDVYGYLDSSKLARLKYYATPMANYNLSVITPYELTQHAADDSGDLIEMLEGYEAYTEKLSLVESIIANSNDSFTDGFRGDLYSLRDDLSYAQQLFLKSANICRKDFAVGTNCISAKDEIYSSSISPYLNVLPVGSSGYENILSSISDMSAEYQASFDGAGPVAGVRFSWSTENTLSCDVEVVSDSGYVSDYVTGIVGDGSVLIPLSNFSDDIGHSETLDMAKVRLLCDDRLANAPQVEEVSLDDVVSSGEIESSVYLSVINGDFSERTLKINNLESKYYYQYGECWARARYSYIDYSTDTTGDTWSEWRQFNSQSGLVDISLPSTSNGSVEYSFSRPVSEIYEVGHQIPDPYEFSCVSHSFYELSQGPETYAIIDYIHLGYLSEQCSVRLEFEYRDSNFNILEAAWDPWVDMVERPIRITPQRSYYYSYLRNIEFKCGYRTYREYF